MLNSTSRFLSSWKKQKLINNKSFVISGNGSKIQGNGPKIWGNQSISWNFKVFEKSGNWSKIWGNELRKPINKLRFLKFLKKAETNQKYKETDLIFQETDQ